MNPGVKKYNYAHCRRPFYVQENGQSAQGPGQPVPPPPNQAPMHPPQYPQYPQQPYPPQYQPPPTQPPMPPPRKSNAGLVIGVMLVVIILIVVLLAYLFVLAPGEEIPTITIEELNEDIQVEESGMDFKSYDKGDELYVTGVVEAIKVADVPSDAIGVSSGTWTIIIFEKPDVTAVMNTFAYKGDLRSDYTVGEEGKIKIKIDKLAVMGISSEFPKQWLDASMVSMYIGTPTAALDFTQTAPGNYTGNIISTSADIYLNEIEIQIYDSGSGYSGTDDGDLTDDSPEEVDVLYGSLALEFTDVNDNNKLDAADIFTLTNAESGDEITIYDTNSYEDIVIYTII